MAKTRSRTKSGQFTTRSAPRGSTSIVKVQVPQARVSGGSGTRRKGKRRSGGRRRHHRGGSLTNKAMHWGWALLAVDFAAGAIGDKLPVVFEPAGKEGSLALAAHFFDADKYVAGVEDVTLILALQKYLTSQGMVKKEGGFGL